MNPHRNSLLRAGLFLFSLGFFPVAMAQSPALGLGPSGTPGFFEPLWHAESYLRVSACRQDHSLLYSLAYSFSVPCSNLPLIRGAQLSSGSFSQSAARREGSWVYSNLFGKKEHLENFRSETVSGEWCAARVSFWPPKPQEIGAARLEVFWPWGPEIIDFPAPRPLAREAFGFDLDAQWVQGTLSASAREASAPEATTGTRSMSEELVFQTQNAPHQTRAETRRPFGSFQIPVSSASAYAAVFAARHWPERALQAESKIEFWDQASPFYSCGPGTKALLKDAGLLAPSPAR